MSRADAARSSRWRQYWNAIFSAISTAVDPDSE